MPPTTSRDFQRAAAQRLFAAELLLREKLTLDAYYFGGYTIECSLKALILEVTIEADKADTLKKICSGASMHRTEVLLGTLSDLNVVRPLFLTKKHMRWLREWSTDLRYESGRRDTGETRAFLRTAKAIYDWVGGQLS